LLVRVFSDKIGVTALELLPGFSAGSNRRVSAKLQEGGVDGFHVARTRGTTRRTQRFERRGLNMGDLGSQRNTVTEASRRRMHNALQRGTPSFTQVQGPRGEVIKPLLPAFLYYDAIPREEYKVLVTEL
jgi:hypothetical protein